MPATPASTRESAATLRMRAASPVPAGAMRSSSSRLVALAVNHRPAGIRPRDASEKVAALERPVPGPGRVALEGLVLRGEHLETGALHCIDLLGSREQVGHRVRQLDAIADVPMDGVVRVEAFREAPLGQGDLAARSQQSIELLEAEMLVRCVADRFVGVGRVEGVLLEGYVHEVREQEVACFLEPRSAHRAFGSRNLVRVQIQARDAGAGGLRDVDQWSADAAPEVGDLRAGPQPQHSGHSVLLTALRRVESFAGPARREVEGLTPTVLIEPGDDIVEATHHCRLIAQGALTVFLGRDELLDLEEVVERLPQAAAAVGRHGSVIRGCFRAVGFDSRRLHHVLPPPFLHEPTRLSTSGC